MNILASLLNLGGPDLIVILLLALLLFGAKKLPELARGMGLAMKEFHKAKDEFDREITKPVMPVAIQPAVNTLPQQTEPAASAALPVPSSAEPPYVNLHRSTTSQEAVPTPGAGGSAQPPASPTLPS